MTEWRFEILSTDDRDYVIKNSESSSSMSQGRRGLVDKDTRNRRSREGDGFRGSDDGRRAGVSGEAHLIHFEEWRLGSDVLVKQ